MRIGLFTDQYYPSVSGIVTSVKMLYEGLEALGHKCYIFTSFDEARLVKTDKERLELSKKDIINIPGKPYPFKDLKDYRFNLFHKKSLKIVESYNLDVIHIHTEYSISKLAIKASKKFNIPLVHTLHTLWGEYIKYVSPFFDKHAHGSMMRTLRVLFTKPVSKQSVIEIVPTKKVLSSSELYSLGINGDVRVVPTGIELNRFTNSKFDSFDVDTLKNELNISNKFIFVYIGRTSKEKNIDLIINTFKRVCEKDNNSRLLIVGGGPDFENLVNLVNTLNISDRVIFTGMIPWDRIPLYYMLGDMFLNASTSETQGLTYIEALASSLPLLVQDDPCIDDVVKDGVNGILFNGSDELYTKMNEVLINKDYLIALKENTKKSVKEYTKEVYAQTVLKIYNDAIEKR